MKYAAWFCAAVALLVVFINADLAARISMLVCGLVVALAHFWRAAWWRGFNRRTDDKSGMGRGNGPDLH